jgi:hypothetical protein
MTISLLATLLFCGFIILLFGVFFILSKKVGVPNFYSRYRFSNRAYWNRIFFSGGVTRGSLIASEQFAALMRTRRPLMRTKYQRPPWEPRGKKVKSGPIP